MKKKASIALTTVILISSILLTGGTILTLTTIDTALSVRNLSINIDTKNFAKICIEESLYKVDRDKNFIGNATVSEGDKTCTLDITNDIDPSTKNVTVTSTFESYGYITTFKIDTSTNPITPIY